MKIWTFTILAAAAMLVGCGSGDNGGTAASGSPSPNTGGEKPKAIKITMIAKSSTNAFFLSCKKGADDEAKKMSDKYGVPVTIDWQTPPTEDGQVQAQKIQQAVNEGTSAILIACSDAAKVKGAIDDAVDRNVPVMTFDSDCDGSKRFAFCGSDNKVMGETLMKELITLTGGKANVAILAGNQNAPNLQIRVQGAKDAAAAAPGMKIVDTFYHAETPQDATAAVKQAMNANPQIDAWCFVGGWPLFAQSLLTDLDPQKVRVVSADGLPEELPYVEKGVVPVLIAQRSYDYGAMSVDAICAKIIDHKDPAGGNIAPDLTKVTKDNLKEWAKQLQTWGFENVPTELLK